VAAIVSAAVAIYVMFTNRRYAKTDAERNRISAVMPALVVLRHSNDIYQIKNVGSGPAINIHYELRFADHTEQNVLPPISVSGDELQMIRPTTEPQQVALSYTNLFGKKMYVTLFDVAKNEIQFLDNMVSLAPTTLLGKFRVWRKQRAYRRLTKV
jgi:hypothetical protein